MVYYYNDCSLIKKIDSGNEMALVFYGDKNSTVTIDVTQDSLYIASYLGILSLLSISMIFIWFNY